MITALLAAIVLYFLFAGLWADPWPLLAGLCAGTFLWIFGRHKHGDTLVIDSLSRQSKFSSMNPELKLLGSTLLLILSILSDSVWPPLLLFVAMAVITVSGGIRLHDYLSLLSLPAAFLLLSGIALLWDFSSQPTGVLSFPCFGGYFVLTETAQISARLIMARALGAVSCLYFLSLSTPMSEIITSLRKFHVPGIITDLAILIYRYIFILLSTYRCMKDAAASRLGFRGLTRSLLTTGKIYGKLLGNSFRKAGACFDAMESRCYNGEIRFLHKKKPIRLGGILLFASLSCCMILLELCVRL